MPGGPLDALHTAVYAVSSALDRYIPPPSAGRPRLVTLLHSAGGFISQISRQTFTEKYRYYFDTVSGTSPRHTDRALIMALPNGFPAQILSIDIWCADIFNTTRRRGVSFLYMLHNDINNL